MVPRMCEAHPCMDELAARLRHQCLKQPHYSLQLPAIAVGKKPLRELEENYP